MKYNAPERDRKVSEEVEAAYSEWSSQILRFATRLSGNSDDAEDILVETFTQAYQNWWTFKGSGSRLPWLYGIAANCNRMSKRKARFSLPVEDRASESGETEMLDKIALDQAIAGLPVARREAFLLVKMEGLTSNEAAKILRRPLGTVLYEVWQAVAFIRSKLGSEGYPSKSVSQPCEAKP